MNPVKTDLEPTVQSDDKNALLDMKAKKKEERRLRKKAKKEKVKKCMPLKKFQLYDSRRKQKDKPRKPPKSAGRKGHQAPVLVLIQRG